MTSLDLYPTEWDEIRKRILERDEHKCRSCGVENGSRRGNLIIELAVAHVDHDESNNEDANLASLCQACHLTHDRADNCRRKRYGRGYGHPRIQPSLFDREVIRRITSPPPWAYSALEEAELINEIL